MTPAVSFERVSKGFGPRLALDEVSFRVDAGKLSLLMGPNGAGKTTSMQLLLGLRRPSSGEVRVFGGDPRARAVRARVGFASQDLTFPSHLKAREVLAFASAHYAGPESAGAIAGRLELTPLLERTTAGFSGGERRRLGLACALIGRPDLIVLDEPTTGLDFAGKEALWREINRFRETGGAILLSTHDLHEAERWADHVVLIQKGRVLREGTVGEIIRAVAVKNLTYVLERKTVRETVADADARVRELVRDGVPFRDLLIEDVSLEEALRRHAR